MKKTIQKVVALLLLAAMMASLVACGGSGDNHGDEETFTVWMAQGESSSYYSDYNDNPAVKYWNSLQYAGENGEMKDIFVDFETGVAGQAESFFNTMIATWDDQYDVLEMSLGAYNAVQLYEEEVIIDLTPYIEAGAMPNYSAWLEANPDYAMTATNIVDGEAKYLQIYSYTDDITPWGGWLYRRDWIVKYGTNPSTGEAFTGGYDENGQWSDNVMFPSWYNEELRQSYVSKFDPTWDGTEAVFISDWEWMFQIFEKALAAEGITDGYAFSQWYPGYVENGSIISGFGGGSAGLYKDGTEVKFGGVSNNFKTYLQCMNHWYEKGWLDQKFSEHSSDAFYQVDTASSFQGKVGMFYSTIASGMNKLEDEDFPATVGIYLHGAREPINDIYGSGEAGGQKYVPGVNEFIPDTFYQPNKESTAWVLTTSLVNNEKDIYLLLSAIDHLCGADTGMIAAAGLTKEQYDTVAEEGDVYHAADVADTGSYYKVEDENAEYPYKFVDELIYGTYDPNVLKLNRFISLRHNNLEYKAPESAPVYHEWEFYECKGQFVASFTTQMSSSDSKTCTSITQSIRDYSYGEIPQFIMGKKDFEDDWADYCKQIKRYGYEKMLTIYQTLMDQFN